MSPLNIPTPSGEEEDVATVNGEVANAAVSGQVAELSASSSRRIVRADQLQGDADRMWAVYMTSPNAMTGIGYRTLQQSAGYPFPPVGAPQ